MDAHDTPRVRQDVLLYRVEMLEAQLGEVRLELHDEYFDRAQMMNEFVPRAEQLRRESERRTDRQQWPMVVATVAMSLTSIATIVLAVVK